MLRITGARPLEGYLLELALTDGSVRVVDLEPRLRGPLFEDLRDPALFAQVRVIPSFGSLEWPNGADVCADTLL
jgi:hypothetical protein